MASIEFRDIDPDSLRELELLVAACYAEYSDAMETFEGKYPLEYMEDYFDRWSGEDMDDCASEWHKKIYPKIQCITREKLNFRKRLTTGKRDEGHITYIEDFESGNKLWEQVRLEMYLLICTDDKKYTNLRRQISPWTGQKSQLAYVSAVASGLAPHTGVVIATVLTPLTAICILATIRVGREILCLRLRQKGHLGIRLDGVDSDRGNQHK